MHLNMEISREDWVFLAGLVASRVLTTFRPPPNNCTIVVSALVLLCSALYSGIGVFRKSSKVIQDEADGDGTDGTDEDEEDVADNADEADNTDEDEQDDADDADEDEEDDADDTVKRVYSGDTGATGST